MLGLLGAAVGLLLSLLGFEAIKLLYPSFDALVQFDLSLVLITISLSLASSILAGAIPSMSVCRLTPAVYLK